MARIRSRNTKPELAVRSLLHRLGFRFRLHQATLPGSPDIVLKRYGTAIFVHGCFWHQHTKCKGRKKPTSNEEYWNEKLAKNVERDIKAKRRLRKIGWKVIVVWECELRDMYSLELKLLKILK